ncbi:hypothetical protein GCM10010399_61800 [Dactylosporangium fulvum]|uniref:epoxide hydrolase family protein n=1 Tax=Dactylosporangium fulvum TaxID=53359 RepID=UPI0029D4148C|nr:epoxide hydrolase [Dactylosporangium fulvum]
MIDIAQEDLDDLRRRLERARFALDAPGELWDYGVPGKLVRELVDYWRDGYDWRRWEAELNRHPQYETVIDGQRIHFLHVRSPRPDALPLVLSHGWPGSVAEFLDVIEPLTEPAGGGLAFHLVIPSLPGFGFSGPTGEPGWNVPRIARAWATLMRQLGYERYGAVGNDWGSYIAPEVGTADPGAVVGAHVTQLFDGAGTGFTPQNAEEEAALAGRRWGRDHLDAYGILHRQQPHTLAHALMDSPVGLLAWHLQIFREGLDPDFVLTNVMIYWLTGTAPSAMRLYYEFDRTPPRPPTTVPVGLAQFTEDWPSVRRLAELEHTNIVSWHEYDRPGHFAAHQSPDLLVADVRGFFTKLLDGPAR